MRSAPGTATTIVRCTSPQRHRVHTLLQELELPVEQVTVMHRDLFKAAGIAWVDGASLSATLRGVSQPAASRLISLLIKRVEE